MAEFVTVAKAGEIPEGEGRAFELGDKIVAVFNDAGTLHAIDDMCPHMGASLASGWLENSAVACPWHGWRFDIRDGAWCENRRLKIDVFEVRIKNDEIQVLVPDPKSSDDDSAKKTDSSNGGSGVSDSSPDSKANSCQGCQTNEMVNGPAESAANQPDFHESDPSDQTGKSEGDESEN